jgi:hypothetical protein
LILIFARGKTAQDLPLGLNDMLIDPFKPIACLGMQNFLALSMVSIVAKVLAIL